MTAWPLLALVLLGQAAPSAYTEKMFQAAIDNSSTAPNYVLITILNESTGVSRRICTTENMLEGAIHIESGLSWDNVKKKIRSNKSRLFIFSKPAALNNISVYYTETQLDQVREILRSKSNSELTEDYIHQLRDQLAAGKPSGVNASEAYRDAIAHVLLERGILCGMGCISDATYISKSLN